MTVRGATLTSLAAVLAVAAALLVVFWVALDPVQLDGCQTSLAPSSYKNALIPVHVAAAALLSAFAWLISARRRNAALPGRPTLAALAIGWAYALVSLADHELFGILALVAIVGAPTVGVLGAVALLLRTLANLRADAPWAEHAFTAQVALWGALVLGLPASLAFAWSQGADLFCF